MFRKICLYITAFLAIGIYMLAENESFMRYFTGKIATDEVKGMYGDLYAMSFLKDYKYKLQGLTDSVHKATDTVKANDLWVIGDSYLSALNPALIDTIFYKTHLKYYYYPIIEGGKVENISLRTGRKKILLIERTERFLRDEFIKTRTANKYIDYFHVDTVNNEMPVQVAAAGPAAKVNMMAPGAAEKVSPFKFKWNKPAIVNQNLEAMLFGYGAFTSVKEWKAGLNYRLFNRTSDKVLAAPDKHNLYFYETIDPSNNLSSFKPLDEGQVDTMVANMNRIAETYKALGFDEVVFSFIPNAVTIEDPALGTYNNMIPRIENNPLRRFSVINVYDAFKKDPDPKSLYFRSDTHWNAKGFALWADQVNAYLQTITDK
jgi:hypothetical protein